MQSADISELADVVPGPFLADPHRRGTVPVLCPLWGCGRIVRRMAVARAIGRHWAALCLGGNRAGGSRLSLYRLGPAVGLQQDRMELLCGESAVHGLTGIS